MMNNQERKEFLGLGFILLVPMILAIYLGKVPASNFLIGYSMLGFSYLQIRYWYNEYREWKGKPHVRW